MKKYLILILISLSCIEPGFCQQTTSFLTTNRKPKLIDSFDCRTKIQYFSAVRAKSEGYILSVDQSKIEFLYGGPYTNAKYYYLKVPVILTNRSAKTLRYFSMSGSWWDIYKTDNLNLKVFAQGSCYKNSVIILSLVPYQSIEKDLIFEVPKEASMAIAFKIGIALKKELDDVHSFDDKPTQAFSLTPVKEKVIWSNYLMISRWNAIKRKKH